MVATSCSRRTLLTMGYTVGDLDGVTTSAMVEIGRVNLQFAAACCGTVPFGANLRTHHLNAGVNRRFGVLFVCHCVAAGGCRGG